jgi:hypothetical protein
VNKGRVLRAVATGLLLAVVTLALVTLRAVVDGEDYLRKSDEAFNKGDLPSATSYARSAAIMYAPGAPHVDRAYARLIAIALGAEAAGQKRAAQLAWQAVRSSALETRHVFTPHAADLQRANDNLARLEQSVDRSPEAPDPRIALEQARQELARDDAPSARWLAVLILGFAAAAVGLALVGLRGIGKDGALTLGRAKIGIVLAVIGAAFWTVAVLRA